MYRSMVNGGDTKFHCVLEGQTQVSKQQHTVRSKNMTHCGILQVREFENIVCSSLVLKNPR